mgnify:CR=1 FL=1
MNFNTMKKILTAVIFLSLFLANTSIASLPKIVATTTIIEDITNKIGGDKVDVVSLVPIGGDPHLYEPIPQDAITISKAQLILVNGLTLEGWLTEFIDNSGTKAIMINTTTGITPIQSSTYANSPDPHAWMDAENGIIYAENIKNALSEIDQENQAFYQANFDAYKKELETLDQKMKDLIQSIPDEKRVLITSHDAFQYYGRKYGIRLESILGTSTDSEAQTSDINRLYKVIRESKVPAIFIESTINPQTMKQIAKDTKVKIGAKLYADSLGEPDSPGGSYTGMLLTNTENIVNGLLGKSSIEVEGNDAENGGKSNIIFFIIFGVLLVGGAFVMFRKMNA